MNREEARQYIQERAADHLQPDNSRKGFICPICGSGSGKNGTGITTKDNVHFTCWAGCFTNEDIIDIIGREYQLTDYNSKLQKAAELFGITVESGYSRSSAAEDFKELYQNQAGNARYTQQDIHNTQQNRTIPLSSYRRQSV